MKHSCRGIYEYFSIFIFLAENFFLYGIVKKGKWYRKIDKKANFFDLKDLITFFFKIISHY